MPPRMFSNKSNPNAWWEDAYRNHDKITAQFELQVGKDRVHPGMLLKIKNQRGVFKFRCLAHNQELDVTWVECLDPSNQFRAFHVDKIKGVVKPKRSRRRKPIE